VTKPSVLTFYSYRGGVGRSMALLNAACLLARGGRRVLMVDFDLEAPGLTALIRRTDLVAEPLLAQQTRGVVDIMREYLQKPDQPVWAPRDGKTDLTPYSFTIKLKKSENPFAQGGSLALMTAGREEGYDANRAAVFENSGHSTQHWVGFAQRFREALLGAEAFDYILVDSRTGLSDEAYISAKFLCDFLVILCGLNDQNVEGTAKFLTKVTAWEEQKLGPRKVVLVASPVCEYEEDAKKLRFEAIRQRFKEVTGADIGFNLSLPYHPRVSLYEELVALNWPESGLGRAYQSLSVLIRDMADDNLKAWVDRVLNAFHTGQTKDSEQALRNVAAIDLDQARNLARQLSGLLTQLDSEAAREVLPILDVLAEIAPEEAFHPLQAARMAFKVGDSAPSVLAKLETAHKLAQASNNRSVLAAIYEERAKVLATVDAPAARRNYEDAILLRRNLAGKRPLASALYNFAHLLVLDCDYAKARKALEESLAINRELGDRQLMAMTLHSLASLDRLQGDFAKARKGFEESWAIARALGDRRGIAVTLNSIAELDGLQGDYAKARKGSEESLAVARELGNRQGIAVALNHLADLDHLQGDYPKARKGYEESLAISRELGDRQWIAAALQGLAKLDQSQGDYGKARKGYEESLAIKRELGDLRGISVALHNMAKLDRLQGDYAKARKGFEESLPIARESGNDREIAVTLHELADLDRLQGDYEKARKGFEGPLAIARELGDRKGISVMLYSIAELDLLQGDYLKARRGFEESLATDRGLGDRQGIAVTLHSIAELDRLQGDYAKARKGFEESLAIMRELGDRRGIAVTQLHLETARAQSEPHCSLDSLEAVANQARQNPDPYVAARADFLLGSVLRQRGQHKEALSQLDAALARANQYGLRGLAAAIQAERAQCLAAENRVNDAATVAREALSFFEAQQVRDPAEGILRRLAAV